MVGVRSSRGCNACRRKKRGCDLAQPRCGQCQKIGAKCAYEGRSWTFVTPQEYATTPPAPTPAATNVSLLHTDRRQQLETTFWEAYLPSGESPGESAFTNTVIATWIPTIRYLASTDRTTRLALDSCILLALGRMQGSIDTTNRGMAMYCRALALTNRALKDLATAQTDATLATCTILAMCEKYRPHAGPRVSSQATDYRSHVQGTARLLELRGTHKHVHEHGFALFTHARPSIALSGVTRRHKAQLGSDQWLQVPWSGEQRQRTLKDKLVDATLAVAAALEQLDLCCDRSSVEDRYDDEFTRACICQCAEAVQQLQVWEMEALQLHSRNQSILSDVCEHHGFGYFHLVMQFWAVSLLLSARCIPFLSRVEQSEYSDNANTCALETLSSLAPDPQACAVKIATHAHYYFAPRTGLIGPQHSSFPLGAALHFLAAMGQQNRAADETLLRHCERDGKMTAPAAAARIKNLLRDVGRAGSTAEFLRSMAADSAPQAVRGDVKNADENGRMARAWFKV